MTQTEVIAREMARLSEEARARRGDTADAAGAGFAKPSVNGASKDGTGAAGASAAAGGAAGTWSTEVVTGTWSWPALAAFLVPGIAFAIVMLIG